MTKRRIDQLMDRIDENYKAFKDKMMSLSPTELYEEMICGRDIIDTYFWLRDCWQLEKDQVDFLLKFEDPLSLVSDYIHDTDVGHEIYQSAFDDMCLNKKALRDDRYPKVRKDKVAEHQR